MSWHLTIENVAGIRRAEAAVEPGVNAVRASNWQGKSSFLAGIETALGTASPLTAGESSGRVVVETDDWDVRVNLERTDGTVAVHGQPLLDDEYDRICADLFAVLDEDNAVRRAVRNGQNLEPVLTKPLDFEDIETRIADRQAEREQVQRELEDARAAAENLPGLQQQVTDLEAELEELRSERESLEADRTDEHGERDRLTDLQAERDSLDTKIDRLEATAERVRETLSETRAELDALEVPTEGDVESEIVALQSDLRDVERDRELLQSVYEANRRVLEEGRVELLTEVSHDVLSDTVKCWLCGDEVTREHVETRLSELDDRIDTLRSEETDLRSRVEELQVRRDEARQARNRRADLTDRIADLQSRLADTEQRLETARQRRGELTSEIEDLSEAVAESTDRLTDLESEIKYTRGELEDRREELTETKRRADRREALEAEYDSLTEEIADLRARKEEVKTRTREAFASALEELLDRFETGFETARLTSTFELVVARDGREARLDALSEGERELLGFVAALAGHEAFEVGERVPVLLLDSLGALSGDNLAQFVEFLDDRATYIVLTAYPEHDQFDGHVLSPSEWEVVSHRPDGEATP